MGAVSLQQLRDLAQLYADARPGGASAFVPTADWNKLLNAALAEYYDLLIGARGHEHVALDTTLTLASGTSIYSLPTDFYELLSIRLRWSSTEIEELQPFMVRERTRFDRLQLFDRWTPKRYRLRGTQAATARQVEFVPTPRVTVTAELRYVPVFQPLVNDSDTFDGVSGWEKLPALRAALDWREAAEKPLGKLEQRLGEQMARIAGLADQRNANFAEQVQQVFPEGRRRVRAFGGAGHGGGGGVFDDSFDETFE